MPRRFTKEAMGPVFPQVPADEPQIQRPPMTGDSNPWGDVYPCPDCGNAVRKDFGECPHCGSRSVPPIGQTQGVPAHWGKRKDETEEEAEVEEQEKKEGASVLDALESSRESESSQMDKMATFPAEWVSHQVMAALP